jgi:hypothetical protein
MRPLTATVPVQKLDQTSSGAVPAMQGLYFRLHYQFRLAIL